VIPLLFVLLVLGWLSAAIALALALTAHLRIDRLRRELMQHVKVEE
jgi:hypothetical protein